jgi:hypothetical protein
MLDRTMAVAWVEEQCRPAGWGTVAAADDRRLSTAAAADYARLEHDSGGGRLGTP